MSIHNIKAFGFYTLTAPLQEQANSFVSYVALPDGKSYFIKIPKGLQSGSAAGRMFSNMLQKLKSIHHPYLGKVIDYGVEQSYAYIIMEDYSQYQPLQLLVTDGAYSLSNTLQIWYKCAAALHTLSGSNLFHRDLQPANILVHHDELKLVDIGWAELEHTISQTEQQLHLAKEFAAPELIQQNESLNRRHSDVYSLAQVVVYLIVGHQLFYEYRNTDKRLEHIKEHFENRIAVDVLELLLLTLKKCLELTPQNRFGNYVELQEAIKKIIDSDILAPIDATVDMALPRLSKSQDIEFYKWKTLIKEEMDFIKKNAFTVKYSQRTIDAQKSEAVFKLLDIEDQKVFNFITKTRKEEDITLLIPGTHKDHRGRSASIGYADSYNKQTKELKVKNFTGHADATPMSGTLAEDIEKELIQYKRQQAAIIDFKKGDIVNPDLRNYLFNAQQLSEVGFINSNLQIISQTKQHTAVPFKHSQLNAVEKSLFRAPFVLIQGPPGTGKTTVITEVIRQLVKRNPEVKILITSQTNLAVDNVLKKIATDKNIRFIRLGAEDRISFNELKKESYDNKLKTWGDRAREKSKAHFKAHYKASELNPILNSIVTTFETNKHNWKEAKQKLTQVLSFGKHAYVGLATQLNTKDTFEKALQPFLPEQNNQYRQLKAIQDKWLQIISNIHDKPAITERLMRSVNVMASTCNHIASGAYRHYKFNFDYMIMDEAAKATLPETLVPLNMAKNVILIGDHKQLPPLVLSTKSVKEKVEQKLKIQFNEVIIDFDKMYLEEPTLFETMYEKAPSDYKELLDTQFRMPECLGDMVSKFVYKRQLKSEEGNCGAAHHIKHFEQLVFVDTSDSALRFSKQNGHSHSNAYNAKIIFSILQYIDQFDEVKDYTIGIITGYLSQVSELEKLLRGKVFKNIKVPDDFRKTNEKELVISTVDKFQGSEKDIIIFDVVKSEVNGSLGFLAMPNRINVAFSRAQRLMIAVGDTDFIKNTPSKNGENVLLQEFTKYMLDNAQVINSEDIEKLKL